AGMLMDRYGPRGILSAGALVVCLGSFIFSSASSVAMALLGRVLMGGGSAFAFVGCLNIISIWFPKRQFAFMAAVVETAGVIGAIIGNFWLAHFIEKTGWRNCMMIAGIIAAILSVFLYSIVRNSPRKKSSRVNVDHFSLRENFKPILCNSLVWVNGTYSGLMFGIVTVFIALWAIPFFETSRHIDLVNATLIACALYGGIAIGGPIIGWVDGRTHWRRCIMIFNAFCASLLLFIIIFDTQLSLSITALLLFLTGVCASSYVLTFAIANDLSSPENRATCIGFTNMLCVVFAPILQPFIGFLITHLSMPNHFEWAVSVVPVSLIVAGVIGFFLPQK
ncbi:MAG: transporter, MFS superfamily, partial [uncultured bacterium]